MKKRLSLIVALAMIFSLLTPAMAFAATSAERSAGAELERLGILKGDGEGELYLDNELNRQDMIVLLSRLMGVEDEVEEYGNTHGWEDVTDPYYDSYISWAKEEGLTIGVGDGSEFGYNGELSVQELLTFMIRALGYEGDWYEVPELAVELGLIDEDADLDATATRGTMAVVTLQTLNTPVKDSEKSLGAHLGLDGFEPVFDETTAEALNLIQVQVVLEDGFNEDEAKKRSNYKLDDVRVDKVELDGNVALLILNKAHKNKADNVLEINSRVTGEKLELDLYFSDTTVPEVTDAAVIGKNVVKVKFSEPLDFGNTSNGRADRDKAREFKASIGNKNYLVSRAEVINHGAEVNVYYHGTFEEGTLKLEIGSGIDDFAGFSLVTDPIELEVVKDDTPPTVVDYKDASRGEVTLIFDEDITVEGDNDDFYHTNKNNEIDGYDLEGNELTLYFTGDKILPDGRAYVYINAEAVANLWDVENDQIIRVEIEIDEDNEGPVVEEIEVSSSRIKITFNEQLDRKSAEDRDNYTLLDDDGDEVNKLLRPRLTGDNDVVTIDFRGNSIDDGTYTLEIRNVEDLSGNRMSKHSEEIKIDDTSKPEIPGKSVLRYEDRGETAIITIDFGRSMEVDGRYSVLDLDNYELHGFLLSEFEDEFDAFVDIDAYDDNEIVEIIIQDHPVTEGDELTVYRVADENGNLSDPSSVTELTLATSGDLNLGIKSVKAIGKDEIEIEFNQNIDDFIPGDFRVYYGSTVTNDVYQDSTYYNDPARTIKITNHEIKSGKKVVIELDEELTTDAKYEGVANDVYLLVVGTRTENRYGLSIAKGKHAVIDDMVPEVDEKDVEAEFDGTNSVIEITFSEAIDPRTLSTGTFLVNGGDNKVTSIGLKAGTDNVVVLEVEGKVYQDDPVILRGYIYDMNDNRLDDLDLYIYNDPHE